MLRTALLSLIAIVLGGCGPGDASRPLLVFAAASLTDAATAIARDFERAGGGPVQLSFGGSSALARQITAGAPADVFLSANPNWVDQVIERGRAARTDRRVFASNRLTVVVPRGRPVPGALAELAAMERVALADPASVPAGIYARKMFERAGLWSAVEPRVVPALDVRAALALAQAGAVSAAVVYATDARRAPDLVEARIVPDALQPDVRYVAVITACGRRPETADAAARFIALLVGEIGTRHLVGFGFTPVGGKAP